MRRAGIEGVQHVRGVWRIAERAAGAAVATLQHDESGGAGGCGGGGGGTYPMGWAAAVGLLLGGTASAAEALEEAPGSSLNKVHDSGGHLSCGSCSN